MPNKRQQQRIKSVQSYVLAVAYSKGHVNMPPFEEAVSDASAEPAWMTVCPDCNRVGIVYAVGTHRAEAEGTVLEANCNEPQEIIKLDWTQFPSLVQFVAELQAEQAKLN